MFNNLKYDFRREYKKNMGKGRFSRLFNCFWSLGFQAVIGYRLCRWLYVKKIPLIHIFIQRIVELTTGISIPPTVEIGRGLLIEHFGGIVINAKARIGNNCTISHNVTIGNKRPGGGVPVIGDNVYVCVGAKILGEIKVGNNCIVGANAVLTKSVPDNSVVAGIPAKVIREISHEEYKEFFESIKDE